MATREFARARVVRGGEERGTPEEVAGGHAHRSTPRAVPRALVWRLIFGGPVAFFGWLLAAMGMAFVLVVSWIPDPSTAAQDQPTSRFGLLFGLGITLVFGLALVVLGLSPALRRLRLLRHGGVTHGHLVCTRETSMYVPDPLSGVLHRIPLRTLHFEYRVGDETYATVVERQVDAPLEADERKALLYDPRAPWRATMLEHLPGSPALTAGGELQVRAGLALHLLILPASFVGLLVATVLQLSRGVG